MELLLFVLLLLLLLNAPLAQPVSAAPPPPPLLPIGVPPSPIPSSWLVGEAEAEENDDNEFDEHNLEMNSFGVVRPSYVPESGLAHIEWLGDDPRATMSRNIFLCGGGEPPPQLSSMSNFRFTGHSWLGRTWFGDMDRRVAKVLRVGDGDMPNGYLRLLVVVEVVVVLLLAACGWTRWLGWRLLVGDGLEQLPMIGAVDRSSRHDQLSVTMVRSSQLCEICRALCRPRSWLTSRVLAMSAHSSFRSWETRGVSLGPVDAPAEVAGEGLAVWPLGDGMPTSGLKLPDE